MRIFKENLRVFHISYRSSIPPVLLMDNVLYTAIGQSNAHPDSLTLTLLLHIPLDHVILNTANCPQQRVQTI